MIKPYVYELKHKITGHFYYGVRMANKVHSSLDLGIKYKSSSKTIKAMGFENFLYKVINEFETKEEAYLYEQKLIKNEWENDLILNRTYCNSIGFIQNRENQILLQSVINSKTYEIIWPDGKKERILGLEKFCRDNSEYKLSASALGSVALGKRYHHKNFRCFEYEENGILKNQDKIREQEIKFNSPAFFSEEHRRKISEKTKGRKLSEEHRRKTANSKACDWLIIKPNGEEEIVHNLVEYCKKNNLNRSSMGEVSLGRREHHKKYKCKKV